MKKVIRMSFVFFLRPPSSTQAVGFLFASPLPPIHPPKTPAPPPRPACETKKRTKKQKKSRQKLNLIPYQKKPFLEKSKIFNLENDREVLAFLGVRAVRVRIFRLTKNRTQLGRCPSFQPKVGGFPEVAATHQKRQQQQTTTTTIWNSNFQPTCSRLNIFDFPRTHFFRKIGSGNGPLPQVVLNLSLIHI